ncbi:hypothetical protein OKW33_000818 [Paraburkholderia atlantica]|uniref:hypothetical protein n=1 Tax=Paraburkholderia atlantica TaxID=2654982 RepID=UPI003D22D884
MSPADFEQEQAIHALVVTLASKVREEKHEFVRGDMFVREHVAEALLDLRPGCFRKRGQLGTLRFTVRRESNRRWIDLHEVAATMLGFEVGK